MFAPSRTIVTVDNVLQVYNEEVMKDEFMGAVLIMGATQKTKVDGRHSIGMTGAGKEAMKFKPGHLDVELRHFQDPTLA